MPYRDDSTSSTLLGQLAVSPPDEAAWGQFVDRYGPRIFHWCRAWGLQEADILDVSQAVLTKLSVRLRHFEYDPSRSFRGWLRSLVRTTLQDALTARGPVVGSGTTDILEQLASTEARDDLLRRLEEEFDLELLEVAMRMVRQRIAARTWEAYHLTACEGRLGRGGREGPGHARRHGLPGQERRDADAPGRSAQAPGRDFSW